MVDVCDLNPVGGLGELIENGILIVCHDFRDQ